MYLSSEFPVQNEETSETTRPLEDSEVQIELVLISLIHVCNNSSHSRALSDSDLRSFSAESLIKSQHYSLDYLGKDATLTEFCG